MRSDRPRLSLKWRGAIETLWFTIKNDQSCKFIFLFFQPFSPRASTAWSGCSWKLQSCALMWRNWRRFAAKLRGAQGKSHEQVKKHLFDGQSNGQSNVAEGLPCLVVDLHMGRKVIKFSCKFCNMASACQAISMEAERHGTICQACRRRMQIREIILELQLPIPCNTLQYIRWIQMYCLSFNVCSRVLPIMKEDWGNMGDYVDSKLIKKIR